MDQPADHKPAPSLRRQLGLPLLVLGLGGAVLTLVIISFMFYQNSNHLLSRQLHILTHLIASQSREGLKQNRHESVQQALSNLRFEQAIEAGCIYQANGYLYARFPESAQTRCPQKLDLQPLRRGRQQESWDRLEIYLPITQDEQLLGLLYVARGKTLVFDEIRNILILLMVLTLAGMTIGFFLIQRFFNLTLKPLEDLNAAARRARTGQGLMPRVQKIRQDEIGELVDSFNHMLDVMEEKQQALQQSEARSRLLTEYSPTGILRRNERFDVVFLNQRLQMLVGQPGIRSISRNQWLEGLHEEDLPRFLSFHERMVQYQQSGSLEYRFRPMGQKDYRIFIEHLAVLDQGSNQPAAFVGSIMDITDLKQAQEKLEYQALYDNLTGLPNRHQLKQILEKTIRDRGENGTPLAVMFLDLDNFKKINDTLGHDVGDQVLTRVAQRLQHSLGMMEVTIARMGGDEFVILLTDATDAQQVQFCANLITRSFSQPLELEEQTVDITFSIGIAVFPQHGTAVSTLLKHADIALYEAKRAGRNRSSMFNDDMLQQLQQQQKIQQRLREALEQPASQGLSLVFQPQMALNSKRFTSGECLCRWQDAELGSVPPQQFIAVAEDSALILPLGQWIIDEACRLFSQHRQALQQLGIGKVAINLSARQFFDSNLLSQIRHSLERHGMAANELEFELTESVLLDDMERAIDIMKAMREIGMHIAIDDFGTGFSSLAYLKKLPITALKIDRTFIRDIPGDNQDMEITAAIIAMAHKLGLTTIAEGVETEAQLDFLMAQRCDQAQGYLLGKPLPLAEFLRQAETADVTDN